MLPSLSSLQSQVSAEGRIGLDQVFWKLTSQEKAFPDWISLTTHLAITPLARKLAGQIQYVAGEKSPFPNWPLGSPCLFTRQQALKLGYFYWLLVENSTPLLTELSCYLKHTKFYLEHKVSFIQISSIASFNLLLIACCGDITLFRRVPFFGEFRS